MLDSPRVLQSLVELSWYLTPSPLSIERPPESGEVGGAVLNGNDCSATLPVKFTMDNNRLYLEVYKT